MSAKRKPKHKQPAKAKPKQAVITPLPPSKERVKHTHFVRHGNDTEKKTIAKPKDWAFRQPIEGRGGKAQRAHKVKMHTRAWTPAYMMDHLLTSLAGTRDCRWTITLDNPHRPVTAQDVLRILQDINQSREPGDTIEVEFNENARCLHIVEEFASIAKQQNDEPLGEGTQNK